MKLKTLKEFGKIYTDYDSDNNDYSDPGVLVKELKEEAVKWIKEMRKTKVYYDVSQEPMEAGNNMKEDLLRYFSEFFNITEGDLK